MAKSKSLFCDFSCRVSPLNYESISRFSCLPRSPLAFHILVFSFPSFPLIVNTPSFFYNCMHNTSQKTKKRGQFLSAPYNSYSLTFTHLAFLIPPFFLLISLSSFVSALHAKHSKKTAAASALAFICQPSQVVFTSSFFLSSSSVFSHFYHYFSAFYSQDTK